MRISNITRKDIADAIVLEKIVWSGRLEETEFLSRIFDLQSLPSTDYRYENAFGDIWQHRINNPEDWPEDWIFRDSRFNLIGCDDEVYLRFLCEIIHPVVRAEITESETICQLFNSYLKNDGFQIAEKTRISGKPVYVGRYVGVVGAPGVASAKEALSGADATYVAQQITRMEASVINDPDLAIGTAKELVETCCKTILEERGIEIPKNADLPQLIKLTCKELHLTPNDIPDQAKAADTIKRLLNNLGSITQAISELRNQYGTGHGKQAQSKGLTTRHAKLAVGTASTIAVFLIETHQFRK